MSAPPPPPVIPDSPQAQELGAAPRAGALSRRTLLKAGGLAGATLAAGGWAYANLWPGGAPAAGRALLTSWEFAIAQGIAEAFFPGPPVSPLPAGEVQLAEFADDYLGNTLYEPEQRLYRFVLRALDLHARLRGGVGFAAAALEDRQALLQSWWESGFAPRRAGYQSLRWLFAMGYFEDPRVRRALGLQFGCSLADGPPDLLGQERGG